MVETNNMTKILNTTTLTFLQETTFIFYTIAFGWIIIINTINMVFSISPLNILSLYVSSYIAFYERYWVLYN